MAAWDGQTLATQSFETQAAFQAAYGAGASAAWEAEHNAALGVPTANPTSAAVDVNTPNNVDMFNPAEANFRLNAANSAAQQAYNQARLQLETEQAALDKAQQAWTETYQSAQLSGFFQGQPTMATRQYWSTAFGGYEQPLAGQTTLDLEQQRWNQAAGLAQAFGTWYRPGTQPVPGQTTLAQQQQAFAQGLAQQQEARAAQNQLQTQAQAYLNLLAGLRGPADWAKYQQVLGTTPGGMRDLVAAAMGQYLPGGGATTGMAPTPVSLQSLYQDVSGQPWMGIPGAGSPPNWDWWTARVPIVTSATPTQQIAGPGGLTTEQISRIQNAATERWGQSAWQQGLFEDLLSRGTPVERALQMASVNATDLKTTQEILNAAGINATMIGGQSPQTAGSPGSPTATSLNPYYVPPGTQYTATGGGAGWTGPTTPTFPAAQTLTGLPLPNQIAPQTWRNLTPSQQQLLLGVYESQGWSKDDVSRLLQQSLPQYATNAPTAGTWRLQG